MTFEEATQYLFSSFPSFEKSGKTGINEGLHITRNFLTVLGNPHLRVPCIHIAGTNGKGSSSHFLASILQESGYKTGLFTSPHLKSFTERIRINGKEVPEEWVTDFVHLHRAWMDEWKPSFFEITTVMAFQYFAEQQVDVAIIETGLGGRLDSSNVIEQPLLCLITNIGLDHTEMLGPDLPTIAGEKAGIIKPRCPVVQSESNEAYDAVIRKQAEAMQAQFSLATAHWKGHYRGWSKGMGHFDITSTDRSIVYSLQSPLAGGYQLHNLCGVLEVCRILQTRFERITQEHLVNGIRKVLQNTGLKGRWQTVANDPLVICDAVHNMAGWTEVLKQLQHMPSPCGVMVLGFSNDKHPEQFIDAIPQDIPVVFSSFLNKRSCPADRLQAYASAQGVEAYACENVNEALTLARQHLSPGSFIFVGGSIYLLSELKEL